jgi:hypothetical protein
MYITEILWLLTWPLIIIVSYWLIIKSIKKFEKEHNK